MLFFTQTLAPILFSVTFLWFIVALVVFIVKLIGSGKIQDLAQKKLERKKAWKILLYPILVFIIIVVISSFTGIAGGTAPGQ